MEYFYLVEIYRMSNCIFTNDNNVAISLLEHAFSSQFSHRDNHEVLFRRINTFLINKSIIRGNIIDLGAWIGDNSVPWSKNITGIVYAIDPSAENCSFINETCKLNNIKNVKVLQYAISHTNEMLTTNDDLQHCSFVYRNPGKTGKTKINAVSLDYLFEQKEIEQIGYIHLDVEGMEYKILQGSSSLISTNRPIITFEQHLEIDNYDEILSYLQSRRYEIFLIDEVLPGCRHDCRNSIAFPCELYTDQLIEDIHTHIGKPILIHK